MLYTVIILNWKRPLNVRFIIEEYAGYACVDEIIVSNGRPDTAISEPIHPKVVYHDDSGLNGRIGLDLRFHHAQRARNGQVIVVDDDMWLDYSNFRKVISFYEGGAGRRIVGIVGRNVFKPTNRIDYDYTDVYGEVDILLTWFVVFPRCAADAFFRCRPLIEPIYKKGTPYGNGEDIFFSFIASLFLPLKNYAIPGIIHRRLPSYDTAISGLPNHLAYRKELVAYLYSHKDAFARQLQ